MSKPFSRFQSLMLAMAAAMAAGASRMTALQDLGGYKSRGKGIKSRMPSATGGGKTPGNRSGVTYPQYSARQMRRGLRRAQGGPGLMEGVGAAPRAVPETQREA